MLSQLAACVMPRYNNHSHIYAVVYAVVEEATGHVQCVASSESGLEGPCMFPAEPVYNRIPRYIYP